MHTFIDQCPECGAEDVEVSFSFEEGYRATFLEPGQGDNAVDIRCSACKAYLDGDEDVVRACLNAAQAACEPDDEWEPDDERW